MIREWFRHAFAVDKPGPAEPTEEERAVVDRVVKEIVRRRMATPAVLFLESSRNMSFLGAQAMHYFAPFAKVLVNTSGYEAFAGFLEKRGCIEYILERLEEVESRRSEG